MLINSNKSISTTNQSGQDTVFKTIIGGFHYQIDNEILFHFQFVKQFNFSFTLLGIIGNLICIFIFKHKSLLKQKFNWYLLFQALTDLIFLTIIFITSMLKLVYDQEFVLQDICWFSCLLTDYIFESLNALGVILTLVLSIDRLYAIMRPMKIRSFITYRRPKLIALILYLAILAIKSLEIILNQPKYDPNSPFGRRCNWSIGPNDFNKKLLYVLDSRILIPTVLIVIPALISFSLNLILWCYMRRYARKPLQASIDKNQNRSLLAHNRSSSDPAVNKTTTPNQQLTASNDVIVTAKNKRGKSAKTSYHLTIVMLNIMDLPYYCFHMYFVGRAIFKWKSFKMETTGPVTENISDILFCFFLLGHSINLVIYLLFHKEFQANALRIIHKLNPFGKKNRSLSRSSDQNNTPPPKAKSSQSTDTFHHRHSELNELSSKNRKSVISSYSMSSKSIRRSKS